MIKTRNEFLNVFYFIIILSIVIFFIFWISFQYTTNRNEATQKNFKDIGYTDNMGLFAALAGSVWLFFIAVIVLLVIYAFNLLVLN